MTNPLHDPKLNNPQLTDRYANNEEVKIHYMAGGTGPLVVFVHGFPDFWYTWRHQIEGLLASHSVAAMDTRGFNLSDAPKGVENYAMEHLVGDVAAVIANEGRESATIVGHDWGGATAWAFAQTNPELTERLVIVNVPHPSAISTEMKRPGSSQLGAFSYTHDFRKEGSETALDANLLADSLDGTWRHLASTWTLVTIPGAGHWPHHDQPDLVTDTMRQWISQPIPTLEPVERPDSPTPGCCGSPPATQNDASKSETICCG